MNFVFGAAGFAKEVDWLLNDLFLESAIDLRTNFFVDKNEHLISTLINGKEIISESHFIENFSNLRINCFVAAGIPYVKKIIFEKLSSFEKINFPSVIHPSVSYDIRQDKILIGNGVIVCAKSVLTTDIRIDDFVHINLDCTIGHDSTIGKFTTVSPGVHISGNVHIGQNVFVGTGAVILEKISICDDTIIGAGAVVIADILESGTFVGIPAVKIK